MRGEVWTFSFSPFLSHVLAFLFFNSILLLNKLIQLIVGACFWKLQEFMIKDEKPGEEHSQRVIKSSLLSGSSGSPDGPEQYVAIMNATFFAPCSLVPIDSCQVGAHNPVFLQQASCVTGGVYVKSQQVSLVNHRPFISFAPEVAVENLLHQRSVSATAVQQTSRERERNEQNRNRKHRTENLGGQTERTREQTEETKRTRRNKRGGESSRPVFLHQRLHGQH